MNILFLSRWFPYPPDNGARIRVYNLLSGIAKFHQVDLISFTEEPLGPRQLAEMNKVCRVIATCEYKPFSSGRFKAILGFLSTKPRSVIDTFSQDLMDAARNTAARQPYDLVIASQIDMAPYVKGLPVRRKILEELEITKINNSFHEGKNIFVKLRNGLTWIKLKYYTRNLLRSFDGCTVVSKPEYEAVMGIQPNYKSIQVVPNGVDTKYFYPGQAAIQEDSLVYSGALTYSPNFEAVYFFLEKIFPIICSERPNVKLFITGRTDGVALDQLLNRDRVVFTGYLEDIRPTLGRCWVNVVPLISGGGTRLKILEALAAGVPVVSTSKGAEGLELTPGRDLLIADHPEEFASAVLRVLKSRALHDELALSGREIVKAKYDWHSVSLQLLDFIELFSS